MSRYLNITVELDPDLLPYLSCADRTSTTRTISLSVFKLIYSIGNIQTRRFAPSNRQKYTDKSDLVESLIDNTAEFRVRITDIRNTHGSETLKTISEDFGVGISVLVAMHLFSLQYSTIQRIYGNNKRPDWSCQTTDNNILVVESKGASSQTTSDAQEANALIQKNRRTGDIRVASLTVFNETQISVNRFLDPPINPDDMDSELRNKVLRAGHYSSVFSFLGHSTLSKYFSQMRKRLLNEISIEEQEDKESLFYRIRDEYSRIHFQDLEFRGTFYKIENNNYLFIGIDIDLISYQGFINFVEYQNDNDTIIDENHYLLFRDGILIIEIEQIYLFGNQVNIDRIKNYQEKNTLSDIDAMTEISFKKYIVYLLRRNGFQTTMEARIGNSLVDVIGTFENKTYLIELKLFKAKRISSNVIDQLISLNVLDDQKVVLITNAILPKISTTAETGLILIGRDKLKEIIRYPERLIEIINGHNNG